MANIITVARLPLLFVVVSLLYAPSSAARLTGVALLAIVILMDTLDGVVARARHEESVYGSLLDIMVDRVVELVLWVCFAHMRLIPVAIPLIYVVRGTLVDGVRNVHVGEGTAPFKTMRTRLGSWLVGSPVMRTGYAVAKLVSFAGLGVVHALTAAGSPLASDAARRSAVLSWFTVSSWIAVSICLIRGIPVLVEAVPLFGQHRPR